MENSIIEKLDKSRYDLIKWFTISWIIWFGSFILNDFIDNEIIKISIILIGLFGCLRWFISIKKLIKFSKIIKLDCKLESALNNELIIHNRNKSFVVGFWTLLILIAIFLIIARFTDISALIVCEIILYFGIIATSISSLIYNRD